MKTAAGGLALGLVVALAGPARAQIILYGPDKGITPGVWLDDQFGQFHNAAALRGDVVVFLYGDKAASEANQALLGELYGAFHPAAQGKPPAGARRVPVRPVEGAPPGTRSPDVWVVPVASVGQVHGVLRSAIRTAFRTSSPNVPVWLDFQDQLKQQCGFTPDVPNVAVLDTSGRLRCLATGPLGADQVSQLTAVIEGLRREAMPGPR
jgi:hypothetical protein